MDTKNNFITVTINGYQFRLDLKQEYFSGIAEGIKEEIAKQDLRMENHNEEIISDHLGVRIKKVD